VTQQDDQAQIETWGRLYAEREQRSRLFLKKIDELDAEIAAAADKKVLKARIEHDQAKIRREFAEHLGERSYVDPSSSLTVMPIWLVTGVPSKKRKEEAGEWMKQRGLDWDGSAPPLRHEVRKALEQNQSVPDSTFGLHVERTVDIKKPRAFTVNLLGRPHHMLAPATEITNAEIKEEKWRKFFHGENYPYQDDAFDDD